MSRTGPATSLNMGLVRRLAMQEPPVTRKEAAEILGVSEHTYGVARDVAYLWEEDGLTSDDWGIIADATKLCSQMKISEAKELIEPLLFRYFGTNLSNHPGGPPKARDALTQKFMASFAALTDSMDVVDSIVVPYLPEADRDKVIDELQERMKKVEELVETIRRGGSHVSA